MPKRFSAQVKNWTEKAKRNARLVVAEAAQGVFEDMSQRQPSVKETGGSFEIGKVPVDDGILINSLFTTLNGAKAGEGEGSYAAALLGFEAGDVVVFAFSAEYALRIEYGFSGTDEAGRTYSQTGRFMVREALNAEGGWQGRIDASARKIGT